MNALSLGTEIFYTGDMANASDNGTVTKITTDRWGTRYTISCVSGMTSVIGAHEVGHVYHGHCNPRFVTMDAVNAWKAARA